MIFWKKSCWILRRIVEKKENFSMKYYNYLAATIWLAGPQNSALLKVPVFSQRVVKLVAFNSNPWDVHERILSVYLDISKDLCYLRIMLIKDLAVRIFLLPTMLNQTKIHSNAAAPLRRNRFSSQRTHGQWQYRANRKCMRVIEWMRWYVWCTISRGALLSGARSPRNF